MTTVSVDGHDYSDDGSAGRDMRGGGHRTWLLPMIGGMMVEMDATLTGTAADKAAALLARTGAEAAQLAAAGSTDAVAADKGSVAADKASVATALATAQALVGSAGTGTATGLVYASMVKSLATATDVVQVLIWDTRRDSDGGAWTYRRAASWYWEALGTAVRGATRRFPAVALIVVRPASVTIHDAHDLDAGGAPRRWMVLNAGATVLGGGAIRHAHALNGRLYLAQSNLRTEINFAADEVLFANASALARRVASIASRHSTNASVTLSTAGAIGSSDCAQVHARALAGGPTDRAGLLVPTVAVATAAGATVTDPFGQAWDITYAGGYRGVQFGVGGRLELSAADAARIDFGPVPYADATHTAWRQGTVGPAGVPALLAPSAASRMVLCGSQATGCQDGLTLRGPNASTPAAGMAAFVTPSWATGWMAGDTRGAYLCEAMAGAIAGSGEMVSNGDFSAGTTGWAATSSSLAAVSGALRVTTTSAFGTASQGLATVAGQTYLLTLNVVGLSAGYAFFCVGTTAGGSDIINPVLLPTGVAPPVQFTATGATTYICFGNAHAGVTTDVDSVSVRRALPDRSTKGRGLAVDGTVTLSALACGLGAATISAGGTAEQPWSPDLEMAAGDMSVQAWVAVALSAAAETIVSRDSAVTGARWKLYVNAAGNACFQVSDGTSSATVTGTSTIDDGRRRSLRGVRRDGVLELWVDGTLEATASAAGVGSLNNASATLRLWLNQQGTEAGANLSLLWVRPTAYAPTPAQIRRMYEDERAVVIAGMPATLGGESSAVTALAADAGTVAVGTGDGVSLFAGVARVAYHDGTSGGAAIANDSIVGVTLSGPYLMVATSANAGLIADSLIARDGLSAAGSMPARVQDMDIVRAWGVTTSTGPLALAPRLYLAERERVSVLVTIDARSAGALSTQRGRYVRRASVYRDAGGTITLDGPVEVVGTDQEVSAAADVTLVVDTPSQTLAVRVTAADTSPTVWAASTQIVNRIAEDAYAA